MKRLVLAVTFLLLGSHAYADDKATIILDWSSPEGIHGGIMLAVQKGWFHEAGLDVDVQDGKGSTVTTQQVAAGQADVGLVQLATMATAVSNGVPVTSIMGLARKGDNGLIVPVDSPVKTISDLRGKRVLAPSAGATAMFLEPLLKTGGLTKNDVTLVLVDSSALITVYANQSTDAVISTVGYFLPTVAEVRPSRAIMLADVGLTVPSYGLIARKDAIDSKSALLGKIVAVNQRAWTYIFAGHEQEAADAIVAQREKARADPKQMLAQLKAYMTLFDTPATKGRPLGWQADADWNQAIDVMQTANMIKAGCHPADFYTNQFVPGS